MIYYVQLQIKLVLKNYLSFRHVVRNNYTHRLDPELIEANLDTLPGCYQELTQAINTFCTFLEQVSQLD